MTVPYRDLNEATRETFYCSNSEHVLYKGTTVSIHFPFANTASYLRVYYLKVPQEVPQDDETSNEQLSEQSSESSNISESEEETQEQQEQTAYLLNEDIDYHLTILNSQSDVEELSSNVIFGEIVLLRDIEDCSQLIIERNVPLSQNIDFSHSISTPSDYERAVDNIVMYLQDNQLNSNNVDKIVENVVVNNNTTINQIPDKRFPSNTLIGTKDSSDSDSEYSETSESDEGAGFVSQFEAINVDNNTTYIAKDQETGTRYLKSKDFIIRALTVDKQDPALTVLDKEVRSEEYGLINLYHLMLPKLVAGGNSVIINRSQESVTASISYNKNTEEEEDGNTPPLLPSDSSTPSSEEEDETRYVNTTQDVITISTPDLELQENEKILKLTPVKNDDDKVTAWKLSTDLPELQEVINETIPPIPTYKGENWIEVVETEDDEYEGRSSVRRIAMIMLKDYLHKTERSVLASVVGMSEAEINALFDNQNSEVHALDDFIEAKINQLIPFYLVKFPSWLQLLLSFATGSDYRPILFHTKLAKIRCKLHEGRYISIDDDGAINFTLQPSETIRIDGQGEGEDQPAPLRLKSPKTKIAPDSQDILGCKEIPVNEDQEDISVDNPIKAFELSIDKDELFNLISQRIQNDEALKNYFKTCSTKVEVRQNKLFIDGNEVGSLGGNLGDLIIDIDNAGHLKVNGVDKGLVRIQGERGEDGTKIRIISSDGTLLDPEPRLDNDGFWLFDLSLNMDFLEAKIKAEVTEAVKNNITSSAIDIQMPELSTHISNQIEQKGSDINNSITETIDSEIKSEGSTLNNTIKDIAEKSAEKVANDPNSNVYKPISFIDGDNIYMTGGWTPENENSLQVVNGQIVPRNDTSQSNLFSTIFNKTVDTCLQLAPLAEVAFPEYAPAIAAAKGFLSILRAKKEEQSAGGFFDGIADFFFGDNTFLGGVIDKVKDFFDPGTKAILPSAGKDTNNPYPQLNSNVNASKPIYTIHARDYFVSSSDGTITVKTTENGKQSTTFDLGVSPLLQELIARGTTGTGGTGTDSPGIYINNEFEFKPTNTIENAGNGSSNNVIDVNNNVDNNVDNDNNNNNTNKQSLDIGGTVNNNDPVLVINPQATPPSTTDSTPYYDTVVTNTITNDGVAFYTPLNKVEVRPSPSLASQPLSTISEELQNKIVFHFTGQIKTTINDTLTLSEISEYALDENGNLYLIKDVNNDVVELITNITPTQFSNYTISEALVDNNNGQYSLKCLYQGMVDNALRAYMLYMDLNPATETDMLTTRKYTTRMYAVIRKPENIPPSSYGIRRMSKINNARDVIIEDYASYSAQELTTRVYEKGIQTGSAEYELEDFGDFKYTTYTKLHRGSGNLYHVQLMVGSRSILINGSNLALGAQGHDNRLNLSEILQANGISVNGNECIKGVVNVPSLTYDGLSDYILVFFSWEDGDGYLQLDAECDIQQPLSIPVIRYMGEDDLIQLNGDVVATPTNNLIKIDEYNNYYFLTASGQTIYVKLSPRSPDVDEWYDDLSNFQKQLCYIHPFTNTYNSLYGNNLTVSMPSVSFGDTQEELHIEYFNDTGNTEYIYATDDIAQPTKKIFRHHNGTLEWYTCNYQTLTPAPEGTTKEQITFKPRGNIILQFTSTLSIRNKNNEIEDLPVSDYVLYSTGELCRVVYDDDKESSSHLVFVFNFINTSHNEDAKLGRPISSDVEDDRALVSLGSTVAKSKLKTDSSALTIDPPYEAPPSFNLPDGSVLDNSRYLTTPYLKDNLGRSEIIFYAYIDGVFPHAQHLFLYCGFSRWIYVNLNPNRIKNRNMSFEDTIRTYKLRTTTSDFLFHDVAYEHDVRPLATFARVPQQATNDTSYYAPTTHEILKRYWNPSDPNYEGGETHGIQPYVPFDTTKFDNYAPYFYFLTRRDDGAQDTNINQLWVCRIKPWRSATTDTWTNHDLTLSENASKDYYYWNHISADEITWQRVSDAVLSPVEMFSFYWHAPNVGNCIVFLGANGATARLQISSINPATGALTSLATPELVINTNWEKSQYNRIYGALYVPINIYKKYTGDKTHCFMAIGRTEVATSPEGEPIWNEPVLSSRSVGKLFPMREDAIPSYKGRIPNPQDADYIKMNMGNALCVFVSYVRGDICFYFKTPTSIPIAVPCPSIVKKPDNTDKFTISDERYSMTGSDFYKIQADRIQEDAPLSLSELGTFADWHRTSNVRIVHSDFALIPFDLDKYLYYFITNEGEIFFIQFKYNTEDNTPPVVAEPPADQMLYPPYDGIERIFKKDDLPLYYEFSSASEQRKVMDIFNNIPHITGELDPAINSLGTTISDPYISNLYFYQQRKETNQDLLDTNELGTIPNLSLLKRTETPNNKLIMRTIGTFNDSYTRNDYSASRIAAVQSGASPTTILTKVPLYPAIVRVHDLKYNIPVAHIERNIMMARPNPTNALTDKDIVYANTNHTTWRTVPLATTDTHSLLIKIGNVFNGYLGALLKDDNKNFFALSKDAGTTWKLQELQREYSTFLYNSDGLVLIPNTGRGYGMLSAEEGSTLNIKNINEDLELSSNLYSFDNSLNGYTLQNNYYLIQKPTLGNTTGSIDILSIRNTSDSGNTSSGDTSSGDTSSGDTSSVVTSSVINIDLAGQTYNPSYIRYFSPTSGTTKSSNNILGCSLVVIPINENCLCLIKADAENTTKIVNIRNYTGNDTKVSIIDSPVFNDKTGFAILCASYDKYYILYISIHPTTLEVVHVQLISQIHIPESGALEYPYCPVKLAYFNHNRQWALFFKANSANPSKIMKVRAEYELFRFAQSDGITFNVEIPDDDNFDFRTFNYNQYGYFVAGNQNIIYSPTPKPVVSYSDWLQESLKPIHQEISKMLQEIKR